MAETEIKVNRAMLTILLFVVGQAVAGIIWGATLNAKVAYMTEQLDKVEAALTTSASKDKELLTSLVSGNAKRLDSFETRLQRLENHP